MSDNTREWLQSNNISILDTNKRFVRYTQPRFTNFFLNPDDYNEINITKMTAGSEPLYTITIPESNLEKLESFEKQVFNNMKERGHYNLFEYLMQQKEEEKQLREENPAVQKAYEQYSLMLNLAKNHKI
jgi:hypothetical protein